MFRGPVPNVAMATVWDRRYAARLGTDARRAKVAEPS